MILLFQKFNILQKFLNNKKLYFAFDRLSNYIQVPLLHQVFTVMHRVFNSMTNQCLQTRISSIEHDLALFSSPHSTLCFVNSRKLK